MRTSSTLGLTALGVVALAPLSGCVVVVKGGDEVQIDNARRAGPRLGVELADVSSATAAQAGVDNSRACIVTSVSYGSPAEHAGIERYDIITHIDGRDYATVNAVREAVRARRPGESLPLTVVRAGQAREVAVTLGED